METIAGAGSLYLKQFATVVGGYFLAQSALAVCKDGVSNAEFAKQKLITAQFYAQTLLPQVTGLMTPIMGGHEALSQMNESDF